MTSFLIYSHSQETWDVRNEDIIDGPLHSSGYPEWKELSERDTKTRQGMGSHNKRDDDGRVYLDAENPLICPIRTLDFFQSKKTEHQLGPKQPFLLTIKPKAEANPDKERYWFTNNRMGVNTIAKLYSSAFSEMGINTKNLKISATSTRKQLIQSGAEAGVPGGVLSKMMGHALPETKYNYLENRDKTRQAASISIARRAMGNTETRFDDVIDEVKGKKQKKKEQAVNVESLDTSSDEEPEIVKAASTKRKKKSQSVSSGSPQMGQMAQNPFMMASFQPQPGLYNPNMFGSPYPNMMTAPQPGGIFSPMQPMMVSPHQAHMYSVPQPSGFFTPPQSNMYSPIQPGLQNFASPLPPFQQQMQCIQQNYTAQPEAGPSGVKLALQDVTNTHKKSKSRKEQDQKVPPLKLKIPRNFIDVDSD